MELKSDNDCNRRKTIRRMVFATMIVAVLLAGGSGRWYYWKNILPDKYYVRASALMKEKDYVEAETFYQRILKIRPERFELLYNIALCREETGDAEAAIGYYKKYLKKDTDDARAMTRLGWLCMKTGRFEEALHWLKEASEHGGGDTHWRSEVGGFFSGGGYFD